MGSDENHNHERAKGFISPGNPDNGHILGSTPQSMGPFINALTHRRTALAGIVTPIHTSKRHHRPSIRNHLPYALPRTNPSPSITGISILERQWDREAWSKRAPSEVPRVTISTRSEIGGILDQLEEFQRRRQNRRSENPSPQPSPGTLEDAFQTKSERERGHCSKNGNAQPLLERGEQWELATRDGAFA